MTPTRARRIAARQLLAIDYLLPDRPKRMSERDWKTLLAARNRLRKQLQVAADDRPKIAWPKVRKG